MLLLSISPAGKRPEQFEARIGERLVCISRKPLLDAARVLISEGANPNTELVMVHDKLGAESLRAKIGDAADWAVKARHDGPPVFVVFRRAPSVAGGAPVEFTVEVDNRLSKAA